MEVSGKNPGYIKILDLQEQLDGWGPAASTSLQHDEKQQRPLRSFQAFISPQMAEVYVQVFYI